jgi:hypothetical protein
VLYLILTVLGDSVYALISTATTILAAQSSLEEQRESDPTRFRYVYFNRPWFDAWLDTYNKASKERWEKISTSEIQDKVHVPGLLEGYRKDIYGAAPEEHNEHKWVVMWGAWDRFDTLCRKARYCDPDNLGMHVESHRRDWPPRAGPEHGMYQLSLCIIYN